MRYFLSELAEKIVIKIVWALPRNIVYWAAIRVGAHATQGTDQSVPDLKFMDALKHWETA